MDSSLRTQFKNEPISDTQDEGSQGHPIRGERATESAVRDNDDRIFTNSALTGTPFHLSSFEELSTQSTILGSDKLHTDIPLFDKSEVFYEVTGEDRHIAQPRLDAKLHGRFFKVNDKWTAYRHDYFAVGFTVSFPQDIQKGLYVQHGGEDLQRIHGFAVKVSASVHGKDGESRRLIQHGPKRVRNSAKAPEEIFWFPHTISTTGQEAATGSEETNIPRNVELPENNAGDSRTFSHTFERIQFERATSNDGKRKSQQQYFNIMIELNAQISGGENSQGLHWLKIARITSEPIIVRGRSPGTNLKHVNPVLDPDLYFGRLGDIEWKVAQICPLILQAMSLATWPETVAILMQILNHARKGLELMKLEDFAENGFSVLIEQPDDRGIVKAVSCGNEVLDNLLSILDPSTGLQNLDSEYLANMNKAASATFAHLGLKIRPAKTPSEIMLQFTALVCMLGLGLVSYSGSHASAFHEKYLDSVTEFKFPLSEGGDGNLSIFLRQVNLSCLHAYIGGPVWAFCLGDTETTDKRTLVISLELLADLWGPLRISYTSEGLILAIAVERGTIVGIRPQADGEDTVSCHWFQWGEKLPESPFAFEKTTLLAIGSSSVTSTQNMETAQCNFSQIYVGLGPKLRGTSELTLLGVERSNWAADTLSANVGFSKFVNMSAGVSFKKIPGRSMKSMLLFQWQDDYPDPQTLQVRMGLEISALTGDALRMPLWRLFQVETIRDYVSRVFPDHLSRPTDTISFLDALNDDFQQFLKSWSANADFRSSARIIIRTILASLQYTGPAEGGNLRAWYVENGGCLQIQKCDRHPWLALLRDSEYESSVALISNRPFHSGLSTASSGHHPMDDRWGTLLHTRIIPKPHLQQPRKSNLKGKTRPSTQSSNSQAPLYEPTPPGFHLRSNPRGLELMPYGSALSESMCLDRTSHAANAVLMHTLKRAMEQPILATLRKVVNGYAALELSEVPSRDGKPNILQLKSSRLSGILPLRYTDFKASMLYKEATGFDQDDSIEVYII
ncbi:meiosis-specific transcription factor ndt80 [Aspergillus tubingensis]|nr:meiosis-specific transcription factor ndt80 [Aspergillus tubingensis]